MPKLGKYTPLLRTVFFLYPSEEDATNRSDSGGTGFLVSVPSTAWGDSVYHYHGVTNHHVAVFNKDGKPCPVIRYVRSNGSPHIIGLDPSEWIFRPDWYDLAISPPLPIAADAGVTSLLPSFYVGEAEEKTAEIGPADDVFMLGRFVDYEGLEVDAPAARFGHISIMDAQIKQHTGFVGRSIVVDMHSRTGFSGSPVFVYRTLGSHFLEQPPGSVILRDASHYLKLLGIHWGQFPELWELKTKKNPRKKVQRNAALIKEGQYVEGLSGMTCVIPAWYIEELLNSPELKQMREQREIQLMNEGIDRELMGAPKIETTQNDKLASQMPSRGKKQ